MLNDAPPGPAGAGSRRSGRGRVMVPAVVVVAVVVVVVALALVAAVGLLAGRATRPVPPAAAPGTTPVTAPVTTTGPGATATAGVGTDPPAGLAAFYTQQVDWRTCPGSQTHQCASIEVPVDYAEPDGDTFELALRKVPALEPERKVGTLLINPGGPGGSCLLYTSPSPRDKRQSRMPSSA